MQSAKAKPGQTVVTNTNIAASMGVMSQNLQLA